MTNNMQNHWTTQPERGSHLFPALTTLIVRYLLAFLMGLCIRFVVLYFYITAPKPRCHILRYRTCLRATFPDAILLKCSIFKQFVAFGKIVCDRFTV